MTMIKKYGQYRLEVDDNGYMLNREQWNEDLAELLADETGIKLTDQHWKVIRYLQQQFDSEVEMTIRKLGMCGLADIKRLYELFPPSPLKTASKIAGLPLPKTCV